MLLQYQLRTLTWTINSLIPVQECLHDILCIWFYFNMKTSHCCNRSYELCIRLQQEHNSCSIDSSDRTLSPIWGGMACWRDWNEHLTTRRLTWVHHISTSTVISVTHRYTFAHAGIIRIGRLRTDRVRPSIGKECLYGLFIKIVNKAHSIIGIIF